MRKPELIRSPAGPNTIVDDNLKVNAFILPVDDDEDHLPELQEIQGRCFVRRTDKRLCIRDADGVYNAVAYLSDTSVADAVRKIASGTVNLGNVDPSDHGQQVTVEIGTVLDDTNYMVLFELMSLSLTDGGPDELHQVMTRVKTTSSFDLWFRYDGSGSPATNITLNWLIVQFP